MKKMFLMFSISALLLYSLSDGNSQQISISELNGYEWEVLGRSEKLYFLVGWTTGSMVARVGVAEAFLFTKSEKEYSRDKSVILDVSRVKGLEFDGLAPAQVIETIDKIYTDSRVKLWQIENIMPIARGRLKEGWTEKEIDEVISYHIKYNEWKKKFDESIKTSSGISQGHFQNEPEKPKVLKALESYKERRK